MYGSNGEGIAELFPSGPALQCPRLHVEDSTPGDGPGSARYCQVSLRPAQCPRCPWQASKPRGDTWAVIAKRNGGELFPSPRSPGCDRHPGRHRGLVSHERASSLLGEARTGAGTPPSAGAERWHWDCSGWVSWGTEKDGVRGGSLSQPVPHRPAMLWAAPPRFGCLHAGVAHGIPPQLSPAPCRILPRETTCTRLCRNNAGC